MGLDKFEVARKSAGTLSSRIKSEANTIQKLISEMQSENIEAHEDELKKEIAKLEDEKKSYIQALAKREQEEKTYKLEVERVRPEASAYNSLLETSTNKQSEINEISLRLMGVNLDKDLSEVDKLENEIKITLITLNEKKGVISKAISEKNSLVVETEKNVAVCESRLKDTLSKLNEFQKIEMELETIKSKHGINDLRSELQLIEHEIKDKDEKIKVNLAKMENLRRHLGELTSMEGLCPLCKSTLVEGDRNRLISNIKKDLAELLFTNNKLNEDTDKLKQRKEDLNKVFDKYSKSIDDQSDKENLRSEKNHIELTLEELTNKRRIAKEDLFNSEASIRKIEEDISIYLEQKDRITKSKHLYELKSRKYKLTQELVELESKKAKYNVDPNQLTQIEEAFQRTLRRVQEIRTKEETSSQILKEKQLRLQEIVSKKEYMQKMQTTLKEMQSKIDFLDKFKNALQATQLELRDELILTVNEVMSSVWLEIYPYSTWSGVRLAVDENDYILQIKDSDSTWVNVLGFASGGERMLAALAMRISFSRIMVPNVSLLILDEPTHNLDEKAVQTLIEVLQERVSEFLDQILVVTHEERLAESANHIIRLNNK